MTRSRRCARDWDNDEHLITAAALAVMGTERDERNGLAGTFAPRKLASGQKYPPPALQAFQTDVCPQPHDAPIVAAAGMGFTQPEHIVQH
jgi:hypothetical protein